MRPDTLLKLAREYDRKGHFDEAVAAYQRAAATAEEAGQLPVAAEALRRHAVLHCKRQDGPAARALCARSERVARAVGDPDLISEALNTAGGLELMDERFPLARERFLAAASIARNPDLQGRIEQNLATVAGSLGDFVEALVRYQNSLAGFEAAGNQAGCAVAYHNLGVASSDLRRWADADRYFRLCLDALRSSSGDLHLRGLATLNHSHALAGLEQLGAARRAAELAAGIFEELKAPRELADAYVALGTVLRRSGDLAAAHARLRIAVEVAAVASCVAGEAEARRELALTLAQLGCTDDAVAAMAEATVMLERARPAGPPTGTLLLDYPASVRAWGDLLAVLDAGAGAQAEAAGTSALTMARALGCDESTQARVRVAAFLHGLDPEWVADGGLPWDVRSILLDLGPRKTLEAQIVGLVATARQPG